MKSLTFSILLLFLFLSCEKRDNNDTKTNDATKASETQRDNDAVIALFNGKDLTGWRFYKDRQNDSWEVIDGVLHCKPFDVAEKRADLVSSERFENFELSFEWKLPAQGNSGVMYRVTDEFDESYFSGPEYQLLDDLGPGERDKDQMTGSLYDMFAASPERKSKPVGEWNESKIVVFNNSVEHWLNGEQVVAAEIGSSMWIEKKANSKWNDAKGFATTPNGFIALQDHGSEVWFRNIKIRALK